MVDASILPCMDWDIVYDRRGVVGVCTRITDPVYSRATIVFTDNPFIARDLLRWLVSGHGAIAHLVDVVLGDAWMLRGTGAKMNRFVARLWKLLRVLRGACIWVHDGEYEVCIRPYELYNAGVIERHVRTMRVFADKPRRIRVMVHELLYPRLRNELRRMQWMVVYALVTSGAPLVCEYEYDAESGVAERTCYVHVTRSLGDAVEWFNVRVDDPLRVIDVVIERRWGRRGSQVVDLEPVKQILENA